IDLMLVSLLCRGHVLLHGVPGLGKTLMGKTLADTLAMEFRRVQLPPDLMPSDITGTDIVKEDPASGRHSLEFLPGPVFTNFLLADEINRTPPKTQAALLQAMQETEVTVGRQTFPLPKPFFVVATQNPIEMEGTYPLPEAQVDRFMFSLRVGYPSVEEEARIIKGTTGTAVAKATAALGTEEVVRLQEYVRGVPIADSVVNYAARLVAATRPGCGGTSRRSRRRDRGAALSFHSNRRRGPAVRSLFPLTLLALAAVAAADDRDREEAVAAERLCADELPRWKLTADGVALDNPKEPVLRWTNPAAGRVYGNTYVWLQNGRPAAAGCLFRNFHPYDSFNGELVALSGTKLVATR